MKVLITGAAGFIGQKVSEMILNEGREVIGVDNLNDYYDPNMKLFRLSLLQKYQNFQFYKIDIENYSVLSNLFKKHKFSAIYNLAARAGVRYSIENPWVYYRSNTEGTLNLLECMKRNQVKKIILASTSSLYAGFPMPFTEDLPVNKPISPYAASKKAAEVLAYTYHHQYGIDVSILRYFTVYGPNGRPDMAAYRFAKCIVENRPIQLFGDGKQTRDFTFIDDIARGTILAEKVLGYEIINLGGGNTPLSIIDFIKYLEQISGNKATFHFHHANSLDMEFTMADISKAKNILNWEPEISIIEGIKRLMSQLDLLRFKD